jgi:hypothetical protein
MPRKASPEVRKRVSALGIATRYQPEQADDRRRELEQTRIEEAAQEFVASWPHAWPELVERLALLVHPGGDG